MSRQRTGKKEKQKTEHRAIGNAGERGWWPRKSWDEREDIIPRDGDLEAAGEA